jgi:pyruvate,orthophosphate dikinase
MRWADKYRTLACARTPTRRRTPSVLATSAPQGIGLCRTEHMFFEGDRILAMREMILAENDRASARRRSKKLLPYQRDDFIGIFEAMKGLPVTIRLLDPPLHEFLPHEPDGQPRSPRSSASRSRRSSARVTRSCTR